MKDNQIQGAKYVLLNNNYGAKEVLMDEIAEMAMSSYKDLMDLGMNVEARVASDILSSSSQFLGHAITAKQAKINKKIKMIELQLKKAKLDQDTLKKSGDDVPTEGTGQVMDRNELLAEILEAAKKDEDANRPFGRIGAVTDQSPQKFSA